MFSLWSIRALERMWGRKIAAELAATSEGAVTERTVRNWITSCTVPDAKKLAEIGLRSRARLERDLAGKGWSITDRNIISQELSECPGITSRLIFSLQAGYGFYPASLQLACQIDLLELRLEAHRIAGDVGAFAEELLVTEWFGDEHFSNPENDNGAEATRMQLRAATSWPELRETIAILLLNTQLQLLATLDLEFCGRYLKDFAATPVFTAVLPRLGPDADPGAEKPLAVGRDTFHYPVRRLLDVMACMRAASRHRKWPQKVPTVEEVAAWARVTPATLTKWRTGRVFTMTRFIQVWEDMFNSLDASEQPPAPMPLMYAALIFTELFVKGSREKRDLTFMTLDPRFYRHWWEIQHRKLQAEAPELRFGSNAWMPGLF